MNQLLKNILGIVAGVITGAVLIAVVQLIGHQVVPVAGAPDMNDQEAMREFVKALPASALWVVIAAYAIGSFAGGAVAAYLSRGHRIRHALVVGGVLMLAGLMNLLNIPHPVWFWVVSLLVYLPAAWMGGRLVAGGGGNQPES